MNILDTASLVVTPNGYKATKLYSIIPTSGTGDMTFARTGNTATRLNSSGVIESVLADKPRLDYLGGTCPKLLMEPQRTNLFSYSQELDNAYWTKAQTTVTANATTSPDGTTNADAIYETAVSNNFAIYRAFSATSASEYTISAFVKANGRNFAYFHFLDLNSVFVDSKIYFNLLTGAIGTTGSGITGKIESYGNGWYRISAKKTALATSTGYILTAISNADNLDIYSGDVTKGLYVWGMQLEVGGFVSSYIPTTTASVTRNVDECYLSSASALIGQSEGTVYFDGYVPNASETSNLVILEKVTPITFIRLRQLTSGLLNATLNVDSGTYTFNASNPTALAEGTRVKLALAYKSGNIAYYCNGALIGESTLAYSGSSFDDIRLGSDYATPTLTNNKYNAVALWKTRLTNAELNTLTTV